MNGIYRGVRAFLRWIEFEEVIPNWQSPTRKVKAPKVTLDPIEGVLLEDISSMLAMCDKSFIGVRDCALLLALLDMGAKLTEFLSVDLCNVDNAGTVMLKHTPKADDPAPFIFQQRRAEPFVPI